MKNGTQKGIVDAQRHRRTRITLSISVQTICVRMLGLCEADSMRDPGTTLAPATLAQKAEEKHMLETFKYRRNSYQYRCQVDNK